MIYNVTKPADIRLDVDGYDVVLVDCSVLTTNVVFSDKGINGDVLDTEGKVIQNINTDLYKNGVAFGENIGMIRIYVPNLAKCINFSVIIMNIIFPEIKVDKIAVISRFDEEFEAPLKTGVWIAAFSDFEIVYRNPYGYNGNSFSVYTYESGNYVQQTYSCSIYGGLIKINKQFPTFFVIPAKSGIILKGKAREMGVLTNFLLSNQTIPIFNLLYAPYFIDPVENYDLTSHGTVTHGFNGINPFIINIDNPGTTIVFQNNSGFVAIGKDINQVERVVLNKKGAIYFPSLKGKVVVYPTMIERIESVTFSYLNPGHSSFSICDTIFLDYSNNGVFSVDTADFERNVSIATNHVYCEWILSEDLIDLHVFTGSHSNSGDIVYVHDFGGQKTIKLDNQRYYNDTGTSFVIIHQAKSDSFFIRVAFQSIPTANDFHCISCVLTGTNYLLNDHQTYSDTYSMKWFVANEDNFEINMLNCNGFRMYVLYKRTAFIVHNSRNLIVLMSSNVKSIGQLEPKDIGYFGDSIGYFDVSRTSIVSKVYISIMQIPENCEELVVYTNRNLSFNVEDSLNKYYDSSISLQKERNQFVWMAIPIFSSIEVDFRLQTEAEAYQSSPFVFYNIYIQQNHETNKYLAPNTIQYEGHSLLLYWNINSYLFAKYSMGYVRVTGNPIETIKEDIVEFCYSVYPGNYTEILKSNSGSSLWLILGVFVVGILVIISYIHDCSKIMENPRTSSVISEKLMEDNPLDSDGDKLPSIITQVKNTGESIEKTIYESKDSDEINPYV